MAIASYTSIKYNLNSFGITRASRAIVTADLDPGVDIYVSFNGGATFKTIESLNKTFQVENSTGIFQVRVIFTDSNDVDPYLIKAVGFFQNTEIGTEIFFENIENSSIYSTIVGENGRYMIYLPKGRYQVWHIVNRNEKTIVAETFNPEITTLPAYRIDKENSVENFLRDVDWAKFAIFDTFEDYSKMETGDAIIDSDGNLSDRVTNRKCRFWSIAFK